MDCQNLALLVHDSDLKRTHAAQCNNLGLDFTQDGFDARHIVFRDRFNQSGAELIQDGSELYIICAPILRQDKVIGLMGIAISAEEAKSRWGLTEKEFMALNFNN